METNSVTKQAFILARQLEAIEKAMENSETSFGYQSFAKSYNAILRRIKDVFKADPPFSSCISHLDLHSESKEQGGMGNFCCLNADVAVLKASVYSFFEYYSPKKEKEQIGFHAAHD